MPEKLKFVLPGFIVYTIYKTYVTYIFNSPKVSAVQQKLDIAFEIFLGYFLLMTMISLFIHLFYDEVYSDEKAEKVVYLREAVADEGESQLHVYASLRALPNGAYSYFD